MPSRRVRRTASVASALLLGSFGALAGSGVAAADDPKSVQADIDRTKAQLADLQERTEQVSERMNGARLAQTAADRRAGEAAARLDNVTADLAAVRGSVGALALRSFEASSDRTLALLTSPDPTSFLLRASDLAAVSRTRAEALDTLRAAQKRQTDARAAAATAAAERTRVANQIAAEQRDISGSLARQQDLLEQLQRRQAELVRAAEEAAARAEAARRAAAEQAAAAARAEQQRLADQAAAVQAAAAAPTLRPAAVSGAAAPVTAGVPDSAAGADAAAAPAAAVVADAAPDPADPSGSPTDSATDATAAPAPAGDAAAVAVAEAYRQVGKPYVYGAAGPSAFDCSGLTQWAYGRAGIALSHYTGSQWAEGRRVSRADLQPGDLVFFYSDLHHMGLYVGGGQMVDAPHTGAFVRQEPVWWGSFAGAVRPTG